MILPLAVAAAFAMAPLVLANSPGLATAAPVGVGESSTATTEPAVSVRDGDVLHGTTTVYAAGSPLPGITVDRQEVPTSTVDSLPATLRFEADGVQSGSQTLLNSVWVNGRMVTLVRQDYTGYQTAEVPIPAGFLTAGVNDIVVRAGSSLSPTDLTRNHDDFTIRNLRVTTMTGLDLADPAVPADRVISLGDGFPGGNATEEQVTAHFAIDVPTEAAHGVAAELVTSRLADGPHTLTATSDAGSTTVEFITDNTGPVIDLVTPAEGSTVETPRLSVDVQAHDAASSVASVAGALDGRTIPVPDSFPTDNIPAGNHTLDVTVRDSAGNSTSRTVRFTTPSPSIAPGAFDRGQIWDGPVAGTGAPRIAAAGDIACAATSVSTPTACQHAAVADVVKAMNPAAVLALGDLQYDVGTLPAFLASYDKSWGALKDITYPVVGNHEYAQAYYPGARADGYFDYFNGPGAPNGRAGDPERGYYSYSIGRWHVVTLNAECGVVSCAPGSGQYAWLKQDLEAHPTVCTLAVWHKPVFTGTLRGGIYGNPDGQSLYQLADRNGVDVILNGHDHNYQRFAPQDVNGRRRTEAPREFIVGTGGVGFHGQPDQVPNLAVAQSDTFGALELTLRPDSYHWRFVPVPGSGSEFTDAGTVDCHR